MSKCLATLRFPQMSKRFTARDVVSLDLMKELSFQYIYIHFLYISETSECDRLFA